MISEQEIKLKLAALSSTVYELISFYKQNLDFDQMVYPLWSAKNVLGHLTFWHESFAKNLLDLANGVKPNPLRGKLSEVNTRSVESTANISVEGLIERIQFAQETIEKNIVNSAIVSIPYKIGSRNYTRVEHLDVVISHLKKHLNDLNKKYKRRSYLGRKKT